VETLSLGEAILRTQTPTQFL